MLITVGVIQIELVLQFVKHFKVDETAPSGAHFRHVFYNVSYCQMITTVLAAWCHPQCILLQQAGILKVTLCCSKLQAINQLYMFLFLSCLKMVYVIHTYLSNTLLHRACFSGILSLLKLKVILRTSVLAICYGVVVVVPPPPPPGNTGNASRKL